MIKLVLDVDRGFACWPFYVIPKWCIGTDREQPYIVHERAHCRRQTLWTPLWWILWYFSSSFRRHEEIKAYKAEVKKVIDMGQEVDWHYYSNEMANGYKGMISYLDAVVLVNRWIGRTDV